MPLCLWPREPRECPASGEWSRGETAGFEMAGSSTRRRVAATVGSIGPRPRVASLMAAAGQGVGVGEHAVLALFTSASRTSMCRWASNLGPTLAGGCRLSVTGEGIRSLARQGWLCSLWEERDPP